MPLSEQSMQFLEEHIPELAQSAVTQAYWQALAAGNSVLQCDNGAIYEVFPDGTRTLVKTVTPPTAVTPGETRVLRGVRTSLACACLPVPMGREKHEQSGSGAAAATGAGPFA